MLYHILRGVGRIISGGCRSRHSCSENLDIVHFLFKFDLVFWVATERWDWEYVIE